MDIIASQTTSVRTRGALSRPRLLLIGPYDPKCGEYTFLSPPLGIWRLAGFLKRVASEVRVFDPNCCQGEPTAALRAELQAYPPDVVGVSTTGMTLNYDLQLAHLARSVVPDALFVAGGMEATFAPDMMFRVGPFEMVVLGEGEMPLKELCERLHAGSSLVGIPGTAVKCADGKAQRFTGAALDNQQLTDSIMHIPYDEMPYEAYWDKLETAYNVGGLTVKAEREARLAEIRSVRLITLNYCPMGCSFCSSTNFLNEVEGKVAKVARLGVDEIVSSIDTILAAHSKTRTIIFQDDIFVFTNDDRILRLCDAIQQRKRSGQWPADLSFISTNRIDAMTQERLQAMFAAGFRVLGFGIESFSINILREFNKRLIYKHIGPNLKLALAAGVTPFLDLIMSSPRCSVGDIAANVRHAHFWLERGCEIGMYPFVIPFSGAAMAQDETLTEHIEWEDKTIEGTAVSWRQPARILPVDPQARELMLAIEETALARMADMEAANRHLPSRVRSLVWIGAASEHLSRLGVIMPDKDVIEQRMAGYVHGSSREQISAGS